MGKHQPRAVLFVIVHVFRVAYSFNVSVLVRRCSLQGRKSREYCALAGHLTSPDSVVVTPFVSQSLRWIRSQQGRLTRAQKEEEEASAVYSEPQLRPIQIQSSPVCLVSKCYITVSLS